ncbi:HAD-like domain-containing protein [Cyathus striatus]|nr:HAD-like domain-containing protein [Cyathus striatus]
MFRYLSKAHPARYFRHSPDNITNDLFSRRNSSLSTDLHPPLAFVFDIDGVLLRGHNVLESAKRAFRILDGHNPFGLKIPFILLTNGGGVTEQERCDKLSKQLGVKIGPSQYIQAHTILKTCVDKYADKAVLALGGKLNKVRQAAEYYGFKNVYTTLDVLAWREAVWPFHKITEAERATSKTVDFSQVQISAAFVFHDPRNWGLDIQVLCDIIQSGGIIGAPYISVQQQLSNPTAIIFCNPDLLWKSDFERPRLGQGAFKEAFQSVYKDLTGSSYPYIQYGKPTTATYQFAEEMLSERIEEMTGHKKELPSIYMVGDNPASDIAGASNAGWMSILVHSGVYDPRGGPPTHQPTHEVENVEEAVWWAVTQEYKKRDT